jgi:hypothetical protein
VPLPRTQAPAELPVDPAVQQQEEAAAAEAESAAKRAEYEAAVADVRRLRMLLRSVTAQLLCDKRFKLFWQPPSPEEEPEYYSAVKVRRWQAAVAAGRAGRPTSAQPQPAAAPPPPAAGPAAAEAQPLRPAAAHGPAGPAPQEPMDLATVLARVDARRYGTVAAYMRDMAAIVTASQQYWGEAPECCRELSRAHELHDEAQALLLERLPHQLVERCAAPDLLLPGHHDTSACSAPLSAAAAPT